MHRLSVSCYTGLLGKASVRSDPQGFDDMHSGDSTTALPVQIQQRIDSCCREFEQRWKDRLNPKIEDFLFAADVGWLKSLLRELIEIELAYRSTRSDDALTDVQLFDLHPDLMPELVDVVHALRDSQQCNRNDGGVAARSPATPRDLDPTQDHASPQSGSRGLHIRCPHCSNPVELLSDTPYESITCRTCGSAFSLTDEDGHTA